MSKEDIVLATVYGEKITVRKSLWKRMCLKFNFPIDTVPEYISNGAEQTVYSFGPKYVLKISNKDFIIASALGLVKKDIKGVAKCLFVAKANTCEKCTFHCIVQERCTEPDDYSAFQKKAARVGNLVSGNYSAEEIKMAARLRKLGVTRICDLHGANFMQNSDGECVFSDYGCLRFEVDT